MASRDEYVASIKAAFVTLGKKAALEFIHGQLPFLVGKTKSKFLAFIGVNVANPLVGWLTVMILEALTTKAETAAFFLFIDMRVGQQAKAFEAAAFANYKAQREGSDVEKANAQKRLETEFRNFISYTS